MIDKNILVIGGYGTVGQIISKHLSDLYPNKVIVAGRNLNKAEKLAKELNHKIIPKQFDVLNDKNMSILDDVQLVIMCIDQENTNFLFKCISKGIDYIDITANNNFIEKASTLENVALLKNVTVLFSIGLAPGITNLLAKNSLDKLIGSNKVDLYILLGLGEKHGEAAYRWTFNNIHDKYEITKKNSKAKLKSFSSPKNTNIEGNRTFYSFNFSDQHILAQTTQAEEVITRFAFDSKFLTQTIAILRILGITKIFKNIKVQNVMLSIFKKLNLGSEIYAVKAIATNENNHFYESYIKGYSESKITAYMTLVAVFELLNKKQKNKGFYHIHQMISNVPAFFDKLLEFDKSIKIKL